MKFQLFICCLILVLPSYAQKSGFTHFSSHSGVHTNETGRRLIYAIGEPINNYVDNNQRSAPEPVIIKQGLLHSDRQSKDFNKTLIQVRVFLDKDSDRTKGLDEEYITEGNVKVDDQFLYKITNQEGILYYAEPGTYRFTYFNQNKLFTYTNTRSLDIQVQDGEKYKQVDFGIAPDEIIQDAQLYISSNAFRCFRRKRRTTYCFFEILTKIG